ncbi:hypothetical protein MJJ09_19605 [Xanthomonas oryzae]|nr:hypothetical protein [Xanthomonas oryzae]WDN28677.1 hypothetical protein LL928_05305 [Xanthomonas oryzae]WEE92471.1 hypothetical protein MJJ09_19605 [Xanthomonas oryzae]
MQEAGILEVLWVVQTFPSNKAAQDAAIKAGEGFCVAMETPFHGETMHDI